MSIGELKGDKQESQSKLLFDLAFIRAPRVASEWRVKASGGE